jgi:hypothetical protein
MKHLFFSFEDRLSNLDILLIYNFIYHFDFGFISDILRFYFKIQLFFLLPQEKAMNYLFYHFLQL